MNQGTVRLCLVLHNHQPIGNFEGVFEQAYQDSYLPFLDVFEPFESLKISLHTSGCLMQWLDERHPEYLDRLAVLAAHGRVEIVGGAFYEPILTMIPSRDRVGQIRSFSRWLERRLAARVQGMWMPERVWESCLTADLSAADIHYTVLDDYHFRCAGLTDEQLGGYYLTEDQGRVVRVFPGSERLRYLIPFHEPQETIDYCREWGQRHPGAVLVFGDDGEKFGTWPDTKAHVYERGWLRRFLEALAENASWLKTSTLAEAVEQTPAVGKIYLPDSSYREMTEWALPVERQRVQQELIHVWEQDSRWSDWKNFVRGGFWRNFKVKYPESNEMYARMMYVSTLVQQASQEGCPADVLQRARQWLYQGQCNCSYWHGAFGGVYLPHLRNAVFQNLIAAEWAIESHSRPTPQWVEAHADDFDFDGTPEVRLANDQQVVWIAPERGGQIYEWDLRRIGHNLGASMQRRPEGYHSKITDQAHQDFAGNAASIHDRVVLKRADLGNFLTYDTQPRKSLADRLWSPDTRGDQVRQGTANPLADFSQADYLATIRRSSDKIQVRLEHSGEWLDGDSRRPLKVTKGLTLHAGSETLEIAYLLEGLPPNASGLWSVEFNFAGLPDGADDRYFATPQERWGQFGTILDKADVPELSLHDEWLGLVVSLQFADPASLWTFPIAAVSQSEGGYELVHQSVAVIPYWRIQADAEGRWSTQFKVRAHCSKQSEPGTGGQTTRQVFEAWSNSPQRV